MATVGEWLVRSLGGVTSNELEGAIKKAFREGVNAVEHGDDEPVIVFGDGTIVRGYRDVKKTKRDLSGWSQEKAIDAAYRLWQTNPLAQALIEIVTDYVVGDGISVTSSVDDVQLVLDQFLQDPVNDLIRPGGSVGGFDCIVRELCLFGEQLIPLFVRDGSDVGTKGDGRVRLGRIDPTLIASIITDKENPHDWKAVRLKDETGGGTGKVYALVHYDSSTGLYMAGKDYGAYVEKLKAANNHPVPERRRVEGLEWRVTEAVPIKGDDVGIGVDGTCFLFQVNRISTGMRGRSDLLPEIDWLDRFDGLFFDAAEHIQLLNMVAWDLTVEDGEEDAAEPARNLARQAEKVRKMRAGSVYAHNQRTTLEPKNPALQSSDIETIVRQLRIFIAGGRRVPEHWLAEGGYTNRATAAEMGQPTYRMLVRRQNYAQYILSCLCQFAVDMAVQFGTLQAEYEVEDQEGNTEVVKARDTIKIDMSDVAIKDMLVSAQVVQATAGAVLPLMAGKVITKKLAIEIIAAVLPLIGIDVDPDKILEALDSEGAQQGTDLATVKDLLARFATEPEPGSDAEVEIIEDESVVV
jgi:hypothetical protein